MIGGAEVRLNTGVTADPRDLAVPEGVKLRKETTYKIPFEFYDPQSGELTGLDEEPKVYNPYKDWVYEDPTDLLTLPQTTGKIAGMAISGAGLFQRPRNIIRFLQHPIDYLTGDFERNMLTSTDPAEYTMTDRDWIDTQQVAATALIGGSFYYYARMGAKNTDGSGYTNLLRGPANPYTGRRSILGGALFGTGVEYLLFLMGGSLVAQYRFNRHEGDTPVIAYLKAISPYGWAETLYGDGKSFLGYIYADYLASTVHMVWSRYTARAAGALGALLYARFGASDLAPAMELVASLRRMELRANRQAYAIADASLASIAARRTDIRAQLASQNTTPQAADAAFKALDEQEANLTAKRSELRTAINESEKTVARMNRLLGQPQGEDLQIGEAGQARLQREIDEMKGQRSIIERRLEEVNRNLERDPNNETLKKQKTKLEKRILDMDDYVAYLEAGRERLDNSYDFGAQRARIDELSTERNDLSGRLRRVNNELDDLRGATDADATQRRGAFEAEKQQIEGRLRVIEAKLEAHTAPTPPTDATNRFRHPRAMTARDVRTLERSARLRHLHDSSGNRQVLYGDNEKGFALDRIEEARNQRLVFSPEEEAALAGRGVLRRFGSGVASGFRHGRRLARFTDYGSKVAWLYGPGVLEYHFIWDKSWREAAWSAASMFISLIPNQPWIAGLKAAGVQKVPSVVEHIPSATWVNTAWPLIKWDDDVAEQQCKELKSNLLHSLNPRARETVRENLKTWAAVAAEGDNDEEKAAYAKYISEGGCKLPDAQMPAPEVEAPVEAASQPKPEETPAPVPAETPLRIEW